MRIPIRHFLLLAALAAAPVTVLAATLERTLGNGLRVIVQEDHRAPVVTAQVWYRVGAAHEPPGRTGLSHVLEHMMFKGTRDVAAGEFSRLVSRFGGEHNAFTSVHYTAYYQNYDKSRLPLALALEADRMRQLVIDEAEFRKELDVVIEERRQRIGDNPTARARERFRAVSFAGNPAGQPVIGWPAELAGLTSEDIVAWYETWYVPNNAALVVVGDVDPLDVFRLAEKQFGALRARKLPRMPLTRAGATPGLREMTIHENVALPSLMMAWNVPGLLTAEGNDAWALAVLSGVLDGGLSARLEQELVRSRRVAAGIGASYDPLDRGDTLFSLGGTPAPGHSVDDLRRAVNDVVARLRSTPPTAEELARVKTQVVAEQVYQQDSTEGQAYLIGALVTLGHDWRLKDQWADNIRKVTTADVQRVAQRYLVDERLTVARVLPGTTGRRQGDTP